MAGQKQGGRGECEECHCMKSRKLNTDRNECRTNFPSVIQKMQQGPPFDFAQGDPCCIFWCCVFATGKRSCPVHKSHAIEARPISFKREFCPTPVATQTE